MLDGAVLAVFGFIMYLLGAGTCYGAIVLGCWYGDDDENSLSASEREAADRALEMSKGCSAQHATEEAKSSTAVRENVLVSLEEENV